ncbi:PREDICTED: peroxisomal membrane protein PMP34-like [Priapulus caudatus]|uniref:Peroxisomal membrane protein PMP34-like n=1 Tax=Priapulus caudatus TaxID=37621 RepID=A0ABM1EN64_PRICU|nr:PREDICTED: peroxisomal membrane protein PMP34-like [Priapulus caudatus]
MTHLFSYETFVHAVAGATGSGIAMTVFYPLDTVKIRLQVDDGRIPRSIPVLDAIDIAREEGVLALYRGLHSVITSLFTSNFVYFYTFHGLRRVLIPAGERSAVKDLLIGTIAGIVNVVITTPLWTVNTRLQLQGTKLKGGEHRNVSHYSGIVDGLVKIAREEGLAELWRSCPASLLLVCNPAIHFTLYEALKRRLHRRLGVKELSALTYFLLGGLAKCIATTATYPMQFIQSKLRAGQLNTNNSKHSLLMSVLELVRSKGMVGMYKGLEAKLFQTVLTSALMFLCYEEIISFVFALLRVKGAAAVK